MKKRHGPIQGTLFEEDYLIRTLGTLGYSPDIALTELVANAWDAGASVVDVAIPEEPAGEIIISDNGSGMTPEQFKQRWMTLGYRTAKTVARFGGAVAKAPFQIGREIYHGVKG